MTVDINNFDRVTFQENENRPIFSVNSKTPKFQFFRFKQFGVQSGIKRIFLKKPFLLFKFIREISFFEIFFEFAMQGKYLHF